MLYAALSGKYNGSWTNVDNVYTTVAATSPCSDEATATVTVIEQAKPNAGTDGTLTVCAGQRDTNTMLFDALAGSPTAGGVWTRIRKRSHLHSIGDQSMYRSS